MEPELGKLFLVNLFIYFIFFNREKYSVISSQSNKRLSPDVSKKKKKKMLFLSEVTPKKSFKSKFQQLWRGIFTLRTFMTSLPKGDDERLIYNTIHNHTINMKLFFNDLMND